MASDRSRITNLVSHFCTQPTWSEARKFLLTHPELLSDEVISQMETVARGDSESSAIASLRQHLQLLRRCRQIGVDRAFAELSKPVLKPTPQGPDTITGLWLGLMNCESPQETFRFIRSHPDILSDRADQIADALFHDAARHGPEISQRVALFRRIVTRCRQTGVDRTELEMTKG
ncbi:hypothetical protein O3Q52_21640 [Streptomyces sp. ActVer]|uniref:hypothetical protein n=1 Tax=Streptomyces sp. ActVer TaxID=3014558 RepID=UPI0022B52072|nr:hypothetical protein [Streptomyces sp. ActVer]MCZ4510744.1 hypothetical protein [Streptomyces sp. ActVer]